LPHKEAIDSIYYVPIKFYWWILKFNFHIISHITKCYSFDSFPNCLKMQELFLALGPQENKQWGGFSFWLSFADPLQGVGKCDAACPPPLVWEHLQFSFSFCLWVKLTHFIHRAPTALPRWLSQLYQHWHGRQSLGSFPAAP
jgi:hypothetical protein